MVLYLSCVYFSPCRAKNTQRIDNERQAKAIQRLDADGYTGPLPKSADGIRRS